MTYDPNDIYISPSSINDFDRCPQLYYYRNVYRNPKTKLKIEVAQPALSLGSAVHSTLNRFLYFFKPPRNKDNLFNAFKYFWKKYEGEKGGFYSSEEEESYKKRALKMLKRFWEHAPFKQMRTLKLPDFPKVVLDKNLILTGRIDWIQRESNSLHIIDFKTGQFEEREGSMQLPIYALLASRLLGNMSVQTSYWYLDKDNDIKDFKIDQIDVIQNKVKEKAYIIKQARQTQSFSCASGFHSCRYCKDYLTVASGKAKLVSVDAVDWKKETYIIPLNYKNLPEKEVPPENTLPF